MKAHLAKVSLALLSAVFLLGCQEQGSGPVGLEGPQFNKPIDGVHNHGGGGTGGNVTVKVTVTGGMIATDAMQLREDDDLVRLNAYAPPSTKEPYFELAINMTATAAASIDACVQTGPGAPDDSFAAELFNQLVQDPPVKREVLVRIDKTALSKSSEDHLILIVNDKVNDLIQIRVLAPRVTVVKGDINSNFTATFSEGNIELRGSPTGKVRDHVNLTCPNKDEITFAVVRPS